MTDKGRRVARSSAADSYCQDPGVERGEGDRYHQQCPQQAGAGVTLEQRHRQRQGGDGCRGKVREPEGHAHAPVCGPWERTEAAGALGASHDGPDAAGHVLADLAGEVGGDREPARRRSPSERGQDVVPGPGERDHASRREQRCDRRDREAGAVEVEVGAPGEREDGRDRAHERHHRRGGARDSASRWSRGRAGGAWRGTDRGVVHDSDHGRYDASEVCAQLDEGAPSLAESVGDGHLRVPETLRQQVERQDLRVVVIVGDRRGGGRITRERAVPALPVGEWRGARPSEGRG